MNNTKKRLIASFIFIFTLFSTVSLYADDKKDSHTPDPYGEEEFAQWQKDLRRFEIISFGAMPFVSLISFWSYDIYRSIKHKGDPAYRPWPLKDPSVAKPLSESEQKKIFASIVGISIGVALIDLSYNLIKRSMDKKKIQEIREDAIELIPLDDAELDPEKGSIKKKNLLIPIKDGSKQKPKGSDNKKKNLSDEEKDNS